jgi:hypothetical protein
MTRIALILAVVSALALSACGGSSNQASDQASESASAGSSQYIVPSSDTISSDNSPSVARYPKEADNDEVSPTGAGKVEPCRLVSRGDAATILGGQVQTSVGAQGPTCIYTPRGTKPEMTVAIEQTSFQSLRSHASRATRLAVGKAAGWCLDYGSTSVAVELEDGRVLRVTGPCSVAARFAARALVSVPG